MRYTTPPWSSDTYSSPRGPTATPNASHGALARAPAPRRRRSINVGNTERVLSTLLGGALVISGARRSSLFGALIAVGGGLLIQRGMSGHCGLYARLRQGAHGEARSVRFDPSRYGPMELVPDGVLASVASGA
jgi:Protein of unknown function (DUF2892)